MAVFRSGNVAQGRIFHFDSDRTVFRLRNKEENMIEGRESSKIFSADSDVNDSGPRKAYSFSRPTV
jgi:hypothetical protein